MPSLSSLKQRIGYRLLRGRPLEWWLRNKVRKLEKRYVRSLVMAAGGKPAPTAPLPLRSASPLRRILFIGDLLWEARELVPELAKIAEVQTLDLHPHLPQPPIGSELKELVVRVLSDFARRSDTAEPDVILFYLRPALLSDEVFTVLRQKWACPLFGMNLDEKTEFLDYGLFGTGNDNYASWAKKFDLNLSNVRAVVDWYADRNLPVLYVPEGYHPRSGGPPASAGDFRREISFVGSRRTERDIFFRRLRGFGVPIEPVGFGWPDSEGGKTPELIYRTSMMNLGIGFAAPSQTLTTLKTRDFECPGSGACYLTTYNWELALHYDVGRELLCYRSEAELVELFSFYRQRPELCLQIAHAAQRRCLAEHTWEKRFRQVFQTAGFKV